MLIGPKKELSPPTSQGWPARAPSLHVPPFRPSRGVGSFKHCGQGSSTPALQVGFSDLTFGQQDPKLFTFTPPEGATVTDAPGRPQNANRSGAPNVVGDGWDRVVVEKLPAQQNGKPDLAGLGTPVSGSWGSGRLISTAVATAIVADDGRIAAGAVPEQVLSETLSR